MRSNEDEVNRFLSQVYALVSSGAINRDEFVSRLPRVLASVVAGQIEIGQRWIRSFQWTDASSTNT